MSIATEAFDVLRESLIAVRPELTTRDVILCPICLREISRSEVIAGGIEHIIPLSIVKNDAPGKAELGTKSQRAGIAVLCRQVRAIESTGDPARNGCNGFKGSTYDWAMRSLFDDRPHARSELRHRHGVAILVMAYLGAFQSFGYDYILRPDLDEIRRQFDFPDKRVTSWLQDAIYSAEPLAGEIVATSVGQPFLFGGALQPDAPLHVLFRRCQALLPQGHWKSRGVRSLETLLGVRWTF